MGFPVLREGSIEFFLILAELERYFAVQLVYHQELQTNWG
ncbi:hypothetical protein CTL2C_855 [Chlamydia trachomatis L2c]|nr:hypothetical protein CTL2C_855 [Chlamydia trachomatis L2c]